jgi:hypothetical protein
MPRIEFIDKNGGGPGVPLKRRQQKKKPLSKFAKRTQFSFARYRHSGDLALRVQHSRLSTEWLSSGLMDALARDAGRPSFGLEKRPCESDH